MNIQEKIAEEESNNLEKIEQAKKDFEIQRLLSEYEKLEETFWNSKATRQDVLFWSFFAISMSAEYIVLRLIFLFLMLCVTIKMTFDIQRKRKVFQEIEKLF